MMDDKNFYVAENLHPMRCGDRNRQTDRLAKFNHLKLMRRAMRRGVLRD